MTAKNILQRIARRVPDRSNWGRNKSILCNTSEDPNKRCRVHRDGSRHWHLVRKATAHHYADLLGRDA